MKGLYFWLGKHVHGRYATLVFALLVFIEGFFIMPVSTLLAFYSLENRPKAFHYALLASVMSLFGALAGYLIGMLLWNFGGREVIFYLIQPEKFHQLVDQFKEHQAWTTFVVALSPLPFKLLTITAGFCRLPLFTFLSLSLAARGLRFLFISGAIYIWGESVSHYLNKYFYYVFALGCFFVVFSWYLAR